MNYGEDQLVFALVVMVEQGLGHVAVTGDLQHRGLIHALLGKHSSGAHQNAVLLLLEIVGAGSCHIVLSIVRRADDVSEGRATPLHNSLSVWSVMSLLWTVVQYALCLTLRTYNAARIVHFDPRRYPHYAFDVMGEFLRRGGAGCRIGRLVGTLHVNA